MTAHCHSSKRAQSALVFPTTPRTRAPGTNRAPFRWHWFPPDDFEKSILQFVSPVSGAGLYCGSPYSAPAHPAGARSPRKLYNREMPNPNRRRFLGTAAATVVLQKVAMSQTSASTAKGGRSEASAVHEKFIRQAIEIAANARKNGNHPFGALLVDPAGRVMITAENTVNKTHDATRHAELNLVQLASAKFSAEELSKATLYTSTEPCLMCCGAIHWAAIPAVVFGCSAKMLGSIVKSDDFFSRAGRRSSERSNRA